VLLVAVVGALVVHYAKDYYVFAPGTAPLLTMSPRCTGPSELVLPDGSPCARIEVPKSLAHAPSGQLFMVDVDVGQATAGEFLLGKLGLLDSVYRGDQLIPAASYTGGASQAQVQCADTAQMTGAQQDAPVAALRRLGYSVKEVDRGALVAQVDPRTPAAAAGVACNDTITAFDGRPVHTAQDLIDDIHTSKPGDTVALTRVSASTRGRPVTRTVRTTLTSTAAAARRSGDRTTGKGATGERTNVAFLGIGTITDVTYQTPFNVTIDAGDIGGPSAGLAFTLGVIDMVAGGHLTGGHRVAATGAIDPNGNVGDVGGVAQKTIAVERAGATAFIVPKSDYAAAESEAGGRLHVYPVTTLDQALADLSARGGTVPPPDFAASHPPASQPAR